MFPHLKHIEIPPPFIVFDDRSLVKTNSFLQNSMTCAKVLSFGKAFGHHSENRNDEQDLFEDALESLPEVGEADKSDTSPIQVYKPLRDSAFNLAAQDHAVPPTMPFFSRCSGQILRTTVKSRRVVRRRSTVHNRHSGTSYSAVCLGDSAGSEDKWLRDRPSTSRGSKRPSLRALVPDVRSRKEIFSKGVPWGPGGIYYLPPICKVHRLRETMRDGSIQGRGQSWWSKFRNGARRRDKAPWCLS